MRGLATMGKSVIFTCLLAGFSIAASVGVYAQQIKPCDESKLEKPRYKVALESIGKAIVYRLAVERKNQTDESLVSITRYFKNKYCHTNKIILTFFDSKKDAKEFSVVGVGKLMDTARAIYVLDRAAGTEKLSRVRVEDNKQVETPIDLK